jgi:hypothetical protein
VSVAAAGDDAARLLAVANPTTANATVAAALSAMKIRLMGNLR